MYLVGWRTEEGTWRFIERDGDGTADVEHAIQYGTYERASKVASHNAHYRVVKVHIRYELEEMLP